MWVGSLCHRRCLVSQGTISIVEKGWYGGTDGTAGDYWCDIPVTDSGIVSVDGARVTLKSLGLGC